ncbi:MAG TPA: ribonuclease P protein component [Terriglobales bacterium]|nr:ribonuclease P protein component [Terriglobales bacterium]
MTGSQSPIRNPQASTAVSHRAGGDRLPFARGSRLLKHADFQKVYEQGRRQFSANMTFFYLLQPDQPPFTAEVGFTVGRVMGPAVVRNRIRRRMRDAVRHHLPALDRELGSRQLSAEVVINPKKGALKAEMEKLRGEVAKGFQAIAAGTPGAADPADNQRPHKKRSSR